MNEGVNSVILGECSVNQHILASTKIMFIREEEKLQLLKWSLEKD